MIKVKTKKTTAKVKVNGRLGDIAAEAAVTIKAICNALNKDGSGDGDMVMGLIAHMMNNPDGTLKPLERFMHLADKVDRLNKQNAAMTAALRDHVDADHLCLMCRYYDQCQAEGENEDDQTTRFWRCKAGEEFEFKEVE